MILDGYKYWLQYTKGRTNYFRCARHRDQQLQCPGRCVRLHQQPQRGGGGGGGVGGSDDTGGGGGGTFVMRKTHEHNHPPELADRDAVDAFRRVLTQRAINEPTVPLHTLYWDEASQRHLDAAMLYPFGAAESAMRKARLRRQQRQRRQLQRLETEFEPRTPAEVDAWLANGGGDGALKALRVGGGTSVDDGGDDQTGGSTGTFYRTTLKLAGDVTCWVFAHGGTLRRLERVEQLHVDATALENVLTTGFGLIVFHAVQASGSTPIVYAITSAHAAHNTAVLYASVFAYVREHFAQHIRPTMLITNYADALQKAAAYTYPDATVKGFWHEYTAAVLQRVRADERLQRETATGSAGGGGGHGSSWLRMLLVLPLLPADYMQPGLEAVRRWAADKRLLTPAVQQLCAYVATQWLRPMGAGKISMFGVPNAVHRHAQQFARELRDLVLAERRPATVDGGGGGGVEEVSVCRLMTIIARVATRAWTALRRRDRQTTTARAAATMRNEKSRPTDLPAGSKRCEKHRDAIITDATEQWIRTPVHLRNPLQFLQLSSHCANDLLFGAGGAPEPSTGSTAARGGRTATAATAASPVVNTTSAPVPVVRQQHQPPLRPVQRQPQQHHEQQQQRHHSTQSQRQPPHQLHQHHHHQQQHPLHLVTDVPAAISFDQLLQNDHNYFFDTTPTSSSASCAQSIDTSHVASTLFHQQQHHQHQHESFQIIPPPGGSQSMFGVPDAAHHHQLFSEPPPNAATSANVFDAFEQQQQQQHSAIVATPQASVAMLPPLTIATPTVSYQRTVSTSSDPPPLKFFKKSPGDARKALSSSSSLVRRSEPPPLVPISGGRERRPPPTQTRLVATTVTAKR